MTKREVAIKTIFSLVQVMSKDDAEYLKNAKLLVPMICALDVKYDEIVTANNAKFSEEVKQLMHQIMLDFNVYCADIELPDYIDKMPDSDIELN